jgi:hypothetical protein
MLDSRWQGWQITLDVHILAGGEVCCGDLCFGRENGIGSDPELSQVSLVANISCCKVANLPAHA